MKDTERNIRRYISCFDNKTDELVEEFDLGHFDLQKFQHHFSLNDENPMFDSYPVTELDLTFIEAFLAQKTMWDYKKYSYFLDAESV